MQSANFHYVEGHNGVPGIVFRGTTKAGREIEVKVDPDTIRKLGEILSYTDSCGHAVWHLNPENPPAPCPYCRQAPDEDPGS